MSERHWRQKLTHHTRAYEFRPVCSRCWCAYEEPDWRRPYCTCDAEPVDNAWALIIAAIAIVSGEITLLTAWWLA
jgi:hypothetical protein